MDNQVIAASNAFADLTEGGKIFSVDPRSCIPLFFGPTL